MNSFNVIDSLKGSSYSEVLQHQQSVDTGVSVAVDNTIRDINLSGVVRSANAFGINNIYLIGYRSWDRRGALGTQNYLNFHYLSSFDALFRIFHKDNLVAVETSDVSDRFFDYSKMKFQSGDCILFGNESRGLTPDIVERCKYHVTIPTVGTVRSLNVAMAATLVFAQVQRSLTC